MSITFTVRGPSREIVSEFYYYFYRSLLRAVEGGPELTLLHRTENGCERSFGLANAGIPELKAACDATDLRGCQVVSPAEYVIPAPAEPEVAEEPAIEEALAEEPPVEEAVVEAPKKRTRRSK